MFAKAAPRHTLGQGSSFRLEKFLGRDRAVELSEANISSRWWNESLHSEGEVGGGFRLKDGPLKSLFKEEIVSVVGSAFSFSFQPLSGLTLLL